MYVLKNIDVLLIYPPSYFEEADTLHDYKMGGRKYGVWPPIGLLYLAGELKKNNISVGIINPFLNSWSLEKTVNEIIKINPKIVGISVTSMQTRGAVQLAKELKKIMPTIKICVGGPHISISPDFISSFSCFDFGVVGEAETTFPEVVKNVLKNNPVDKIIFADIPHNLDEISFPAWELIDPKEYYGFQEKTAPLISVRGCPFNCIFCSRVAVSDRVRYRSAKLIVDEIEKLINQYDNFVFLDDTFTINKKHTGEICNEIIRRNLKIKWACNTRANLLDYNLLKLMKKSGCTLVLFGIETGNEEFRNKVVKKMIKNSDIESAVKNCKKLGITVGGYLMLGFPGETKEYMQETVDFPTKHDLDIMSIHATTIYPGSSIAAIYEKENNISLKEMWNQYAAGKIKIEDITLVYVPKGMTMEDIKRFRKKAYLKFYFRPKTIWYWLKKDLFSMKNLVRDFLTALTLLKYGKTSKDLK